MNLLNNFDDWMISREQREKTSHYASGLLNCARQMYYQWTGEEKSNPPEPGAILKMKMGEKAEDIMADYFDSLVEAKAIDSWIAQFPVEIHPPQLNFPIHGKMDAILVSERGRMGIEIKSSYGMGIKNIQVTGEPKHDHLVQVYAYLIAEHEQLSQFKIIYLGRDNGYRTEFDISIVPDGVRVNGVHYQISWKRIMDRLGLVEEYVEKSIIPGREYVLAIKNGEARRDFQADNVKYKSSWQCNYCDWRDKCWAEELASDGDNREMVAAHEEPVYVRVV